LLIHDIEGVLKTTSRSEDSTEYNFDVHLGESSKLGINRLIDLLDVHLRKAGKLSINWLVDLFDMNLCKTRLLSIIRNAHHFDALLIDTN